MTKWLHYLLQQTHFLSVDTPRLPLESNSKSKKPERFLTLGKALALFPFNSNKKFGETQEKA